MPGHSPSVTKPIQREQRLFSINGARKDEWPIRGEELQLRKNFDGLTGQRNDVGSIDFHTFRRNHNARFRKQTRPKAPRSIR